MSNTYTGRGCGGAGRNQTGDRTCGGRGGSKCLRVQVDMCQKRPIKEQKRRIKEQKRHTDIVSVCVCSGLLNRSNETFVLVGSVLGLRSQKPAQGRLFFLFFLAFCGLAQGWFFILFFRSQKPAQGRFFFFGSALGPAYKKLRKVDGPRSE